MDILSLQYQPLWLAVAVYIAAAVVTWVAGSRISGYADQISRRTGIGGAVVGMALLGAVTSLPEIATSTTAALAGDAGLAVSNLLGGVAFQIVVLAVADAFIGRKALTATLPNPSTMLQAMVCILLLALAVSGTIVGDVDFLGVGAWSAGMLIVYAASLYFVRQQEQSAGWTPGRDAAGRGSGPPAQDNRQQPSNDGVAGDQNQGSNFALGLRTFVVATIILAAGFVLTRSAEAIAGQVGLSTNLAGLTLLAVATSLPEVSTALSAVKLRRNDLAIGDVLGGNMFDVMLIFLVDALYTGPAVLNEVGEFAGFAGVLGIVLTTFYLIGMIERRDRTFLKMGYDSLAVIIGYAGGVLLLVRMASPGAGG